MADPHENPDASPTESHLPATDRAPSPLDSPESLASPEEAQPEGKEISRKEPVAPIRFREIFAVLLIVVLADLGIYQGGGPTGWAAFLLGLPALLLVGRRQIPRPFASFCLWGLLGLLALKLIWSGSSFGIVMAVGLVIGFVMTLVGLSPFVIDSLIFAAQVPIAGLVRLDDYAASLRAVRWTFPKGGLFRYGFPAGVVAVFSGIFVLANPNLHDVAQQFFTWISSFFDGSDWRYVPSLLQVIFWFAVMWFSLGFLAPVMKKSILDRLETEPRKPKPSVESDTYPAFLNTFWAVIVLFCGYLVFEFRTLWFREFPEGFHYSGYAHEGAAWLTIALIVATLLLSYVFRGAVLDDPRIGRLKRLAWVWSILNFALAVAVFHRLLIYVGFNGMTRMRVVGFLGISAVVGGFVIVLRKIARDHSFLWVFRRQMWVLAFAIYFGITMPVDALIHRYNVARILAGDPAPAVQISVHPIDPGGYRELLPLLASENGYIREGVRVMLYRQHVMFRNRRSQHPEGVHWTQFQLADHMLERDLQQNREQLEKVPDDKTVRNAVLIEFRQYAYQWY